MSDDGRANITPARVDAARAVYDLVHALVGTVTDDDTLGDIARAVREATSRLDGAPLRVRTVPDFATVQAMRKAGEDTTFLTMGDRPIAGPANPTAVHCEPRWDDDGVAHADVWFGPAFEAAPGHVHGGMVAAVFDDILGMAMARVRSPGFTGRLTVHYRAPVPMNQRIEFRAWGEEPDGRKLVVHSEARLDGRLLAEAEALFILVDPSHFATHADELPPRGRRALVMRRLVSVPGLVLVGLAFVVLLPLWLPIALVIDLVTAPRRLPRTRLLAFGLWWSWLEIAALTVAGWLFVTGRAHRTAPHYRLQRWWANGLVVGLRTTCRLHLEPRHFEVLTPGPVVVLPRHASLADALLSAWFVTQVGLEPRYVLKRELLADPCLDVVGNRLPDHFLDRHAADTGPELTALRELATGATGANDAVVIFPEGTRANPEKRARGLARLADRNPARAAKLSALQHLNPPRLAGTLAVLDGAETADVVFIAHAGFEGLDTFGGILRSIPGRAPVLVDCERVARRDVPAGADARTAWLDDEWLRMDDRVDALIRERVALAEGVAAR